MNPLVILFLQLNYQFIRFVYVMLTLLIDKYLIQPIDANDNGVPIADYRYEDIREYTIGDFLSSYIVDHSLDQNEIYKVFMSNVKTAKDLLKREILRAKEFIKAEDVALECYQNSKDKRLIEVLNEGMPWEIILAKFPEPLYVIYPRRDNHWGIRAIRDTNKAYGDSRKPLPLVWAGKRDEEFRHVPPPAGSDQPPGFRSPDGIGH